MTLDATKPTDQESVSVLPEYIREGRAAINAFVVGNSEFTVTTALVAAGTTALVVGTDLVSIDMEIVLISGLGLATIEQIRGGIEGQLKTFIFSNNVLTFKDGLKSGGQLYLNQLPVLSNFDAQIDDVITLININGNGSTEYGYWKELNRQISVK